MPANRAQTIALRASRLMRARGSPITLRRTTLDDGPETLPNPARVANLRVSGAHAAGGTMISIVGGTFIGRLIAGDELEIGEQTYLVTADAAATADAATVPVLPALPDDLADGEPVRVTWSADLTVWASVSAGSQTLVSNGAVIELRSYSILIPAYDLPAKPDQQWRVVLDDGEERPITSVMPRFVDGQPALWALECR